MRAAEWRVPALLGLVVWAGATAAFLTLGDVIVPEDHGAGPVLFALGFTVVAVVAGALAAVVHRRIEPSARTDAAAYRLSIALVFIGLIGDALLMLFSDTKYPGLEASRQLTLATGLLLAYGGLAAGPLLVTRGPSQ